MASTVSQFNNFITFDVTLWAALAASTLRSYRLACSAELSTFLSWPAPPYLICCCISGAVGLVIGVQFPIHLQAHQLQRCGATGDHHLQHVGLLHLQLRKR
jgi:hypothetical protein